MKKYLFLLYVLLLFAGCGNSIEPRDAENNSMINSIPIATFENFSISKNSRYDGQLTAIDKDGDILKYIIVDQPLHGTVTLYDNGCFTYVPENGYIGEDSFSYRASDDLDSCAVKKIIIDVCKSTTKPPIAPSNLKIKALSTTSLELTWQDTSDNEEGFVIYKDGILISTTKENETKKVIDCGLEAGRSYSFEVRAKNEAGVSSPITMIGATKDVVAPPIAPTNLEAVAIDNTNLRLRWNDNADNETFYEVYQDNIKIKTIPSDCTCVIVKDLQEGIQYSFMVKAVNKLGKSSSNKITIFTAKSDAVPVNHAPIAISQTINMQEDTTKEILLSATDEDGDSLSYSIATLPKYGTFNNGVYTPNQDYFGTDSFTFKANDGKIDSMPATIDIVIKDINDVPSVDAGDDINITEGDSYTPVVKSSDIDGEIINTVWKEGNSTITFPKDDFSVGTHTLKVTVTDDDGAIATDDLILTVKAKKVSCSISRPIIKTGQTFIYEKNDDGDLQRGIERNFVRDDEKEIVIDNSTNLQWQDDNSTETAVKKWSEAVEYCENLTHGGYDDWRLPNVDELLYLVDRDIASPQDLNYNSVIDYSFKHRTIDAYWSNVKSSSNTDYAWALFYSTGADRKVAIDDKLHIRCVRNELLNSEDSFVRDDDLEVVIDSQACLMWQDNLDTKSIRKSRSDAIKYCEELEFAGFSDWHLPNINELYSIGDKNNNTSINSEFINVMPDYYWTSTNKQNSDFHWGISFVNASAEAGYMSIEVYLRCVRDVK